MKTLYSLKARLFTFACLLLTAPALWAQTVLKGKILDEFNQEPLIGATANIKGTNLAASTDVNGDFSLSVPNSPPFTLVFQYIGYLAKEVEVFEADQELSITLKPRLSIPEVVITAAGIESERKSINYTITEIQGKEIQQARETNITTALSGKIAGVQIGNSGGAPGGSSSVRIRGSSSVLGNNSPLFVVDGVPVDNSTQDLLPNITNSVSLATPSNRAIDFNPNDVDNITVLKGPAAAALYGIRAANGAVIINTKRGSKLTDKDVQVSFSTSAQIDQKNRRLQPRQHRFSNGLNGNYILPGQTSSDENWGALLDTLTYSNLPSQFDNNGQIVGAHHAASNGAPVNHYNNEDAFFRNGLTLDNHLSLSGKLAQKGGYYASVGRLFQTGIVPTTDFYRTTLRLNADYNLTEKFKLSTGFNYTNSGANNRSLNGGYGTNAIRALINSPDNFDITNGLSDPENNPASYELAPTAAKPWGASRAYAGGNGWDNPLWSVNKNPQKDDVNRYVGYVQLDYQVRPWLKATFRPGLDAYRDIRNAGFANGSNGVGKGVVNVTNFYRKDLNTDFILSANRNLTENVELVVNLGHNYYDSYRYQSNVRGDGLVVKDLYSLSNASSISALDQAYRKRLVAIYGNAILSYKKWLFLNVSARNEWSSTLPRNKNRLLYPSIGTSFIFTDAFRIRNSYLSFGKLRATYAVVGNDTDPYSLDTYYNNTSLINNSLQAAFQTPFIGSPGLSSGSSAYGISYVLGNPNLTPERIKSFEVGAELRFLKNRVGLDVAYYHNVSTNQIIPVSLPNSTGYRAAISNTGQVTNKGIELALEVTPVQTKDFSWDAALIYYKNISKVDALAPGLDNISLYGALTESRAVVGQPFGVIVGVDVQRNENGRPIIDDNPALADGTTENPNYGLPKVNSRPTVLGDPNPDFNASWRNTFTYKFVTLSVLLDTRYGFDLANNPRQQMVFNGVDESTENRDKSLTIDGVRASNGAENDIAIAPESATYHKQQAWYRKTFDIGGLYVEKGLYWLKLKDVNLTFALPSVWLKPLKISAASLTFTARNFILATNYTGSDPDLTTRNGLTNGQGIDFWTTPNTHSYGTSLNVTF